MAENAKNPMWKPPVELPGVIPEDYRDSIDSGNGSAQSADTQDGTKGFSPERSGHAKNGHSHTSSFDGNKRSEPVAIDAAGWQAGQEEGGRQRQKTTSVAGRVSPVHK